ncbi:hypothetical protein Bsph_1455 [Lysinibacillus sphaericus C3-41]|uniref:Uncharacterized protein n=1 Tax=Lysinibacillus sphaericus (strain C3-41) TaxID=444177 RepID=B1HQB2_LYSSC|nr:hypothetical protein Bsph_1455 [Lysinibacillus sphaericus C3-41]
MAISIARKVIEIAFLYFQDIWNRHIFDVILVIVNGADMVE